MKCKILFVIGQLGIGGQERQLYYLLKSMDKNRYHPQVVVWNYNENDVYVNLIKKLGVLVKPVSVSTNSMSILFSLYQIVNKVQPELIHSYSFYTNFIVWLVSLGRKVIPIGSVRSSFSMGRKECGVFIGLLSSRWPRWQIYNNWAAANEVKSKKRFFVPHHIDIVINAVDMEKFYPMPFTKRSITHIGAIGSLTPIKRFDLLINAAKILKARNLYFSIEIAGTGPLQEELLNLIEANEVNEQVKLMGNVSQIEHFISKCDFLVLCSDFEGCPNVVMEAMASGRPVVSTSVGDVPYLIDNGIHGFLVDANNAEKLSEKMGKLINNPELCKIMGQAARIKAEQIFDISRLAKETLASYNEAGFSTKC